LSVNALDGVMTSLFYPDETRLAAHRLRQAISEGNAKGDPFQ
jgi:hypothetical protein